jgi:ubiquinone/menaquinone biosynthesis C-methylase UbiE
MENSTKIIDYYEEATKDYEFWSKDFNMHFGLVIWNIFNREKMLRKMNLFVLENINGEETNSHYLDLGCGCGATLRQGCQTNKDSKYTGVTLSKWQIDKCKELMHNQNITNGDVIEGDYHHLPFDDENFNGAYALESLCHSNNRLKVLKEASRVLKKGSKLVVADGFIKVDSKKAGWLFKKMYKILCEGWALPNLANINEFKTQLKEAGFKIKEVKDISWQIAPSVLHAPFIVVKYLIYCLLGKAPLKKQNINNLKGSFVSLFMGLQRSKFSYYVIVAEKK